ncbi:ATP-binding cassette domain-containing protein [Myxococcota bacterium]|nr:ATP-binding cassette domain-containing protein [Myxococcota bacterium]
MSASLVAQDLRWRWPGGFALGPVDLSLGPGLWLLRGRNGAGKTTLLRCLCGGLVPTTGQVRICGEDPVASAHARRLVSWAPAQPDLPDFLTIDEAWRTLAALRGAPAWPGEPLRDRMGLPPHLRLSHASAGQRRLAGLLAALAGDPAVLLLDEPLSHVDAAGRAEILALLGVLRAERVVLVTSHEDLPVAVDGQAELVAGRGLGWSGG